MTNKHLSIFNQLRPVTIGFDNVFDHFERMFDDDVFRAPMANFPPYNIVKTGDFTYDVELALAGYSKEDITVDYADNILSVKSVKAESTDTDESILHRGIAKRYFSKSFTIAGYNTRARKSPINITDSNGRGYKCSVAMVKMYNS